MTDALPTPFIRDIQAAVVAHYGLTLADMTSQARCRSIARPRQIAMFLSRSLTPRSLPEISRYFGGRHHTTALHAVREVERLLSSDLDACESAFSIIAAVAQLTADRMGSVS